METLTPVCVVSTDSENAAALNASSASATPIPPAAGAACAHSMAAHSAAASLRFIAILLIRFPLQINSREKLRFIISLFEWLCNLHPRHERFCQPLNI